MSAPGAPGRANDDAFASGAGFAIVIDGATGLGDERLVAESGSDAAWLAGEAAALLSDGLREVAFDARDLVRSVNRQLRERLEAAMRSRSSDGPRSIAEAPAYALPTAAFQALRIAPRSDANGVLLESFGLGDCSMLLLDADDRFWRVRGVAAQRGAEQEAAARLLAETGGLDHAGGVIRKPAVLERLRRARATHNTPGGWFWTLGVAAEAADHLLIERRAVRLPALALLATDGFSDLADLYRLYDAPGLVRAAADKGLAHLIDELRRIEREIDPTGARYPRIKQSDDATAVLVRIDQPAQQ